MPSTRFNVPALAGGMVSAVLSILAFKSFPTKQPLHARLPDFAMGVAAAVWLIYLLVTKSLNLSPNLTLTTPALSMHPSYAAHMLYQLSIICVGFLLLACAGTTGLKAYVILAAQAVVGVAVLDWHQSYGIRPGELSNHISQTGAYQIWVVVNLLAAAWLTVLVAIQKYGVNSLRGWLVLAGCLVGLGLGLNHLLITSEFRNAVTASDYLYAAFLIAIWYGVTRRLKSLSSPFSPASDFQHSAHSGAGMDFGPIQNEIALALELERHRIAQDLHDGVGSQIAVILCTLENSGPEQEHLVLALEQCLIDLKTTVDAMDGANDNIVEALGNLRYRFQHTLDRLNITIIWRLELCGELEKVHGTESQQALRIAQESLANVIRHAQASVIEVVCLFDPDTNHMILDVRDNGKGIAYIPEGRTTGRGLPGMRQRAHHLGGKLMISSKPGAGTCVRLMLPLKNVAS